MPPGVMFRYWIRPTARPLANMPFSARSVGFYRIHTPFSGKLRVRYFVAVFWCVSGQGTFVFNNRARTLSKRQVAIFLPGMVHQWRMLRAPFEFHYFTLDGPFAAQIAMAFGLSAGIHPAGPVPTHLFRRLESAIRRPSRSNEVEAATIGFELLARAAATYPHHSDDLADAALEIIHRDWPLAALSVKTLAAALRVHRSVLSRRIHDAVGASPTDYINRLRLQNALTLLSHTRKPISDIASQCGFTDHAYFSRVVRRTIGTSPMAYRFAESACGTSERDAALAAKGGRGRNSFFSLPKFH